MTIIGVGILTTRGGDDDDDDEGMEMVAIPGRGTPTSNPLLPGVTPPSLALEDSAVEVEHRAGSEASSYASPRGRRRSRTHSITCTSAVCVCGRRQEWGLLCGE